MITAILLGVVLGVITGVLPGIGVTTLLLSMYTLLGQFSLLELFVFYAVLMSSLQYYGNVSSILYGVYGELTSGPAVKHGHALFKANTAHGIDALIYTATGSFISSLLALGLLAIAFQYVDFLMVMFGNTAKVVVVSLALLLLIMSTQNKLLGILAAITGIVAGKVGYDVLFETRFLSGTVSNFLDGGIPLTSVFVGLIALPQLWQMYCTNKDSVEIVDWKDTNIKYRIRTLFTMPYHWSAVRGSIVGVITGFIPGVSYVISSAVASNIEEKICKRRNDTITDTNFRCVVSAESANNAGSMVVLIPLLVLALPVIPSEAVIFSIAERIGFGHGVSYNFLSEHGTTLLLVLLAVNVFNWILSGVFYNFVSRIFNCMKKYVYQGLCIFILVMVVLSASITNQVTMTLAFLFLFALLGLLIKNEGVKITLMFSFFLADTIVGEYYRFYLFHF
jgi:putative tricarboxylic transport membrane protein